MPYRETPAERQKREQIEYQRQVAAERAAAVEPTIEQMEQYFARQSKSVAQEAQERQDEETVKTWLSAHPEYKATPQGGAAMEEYLNARGLPFSAENLTAAFTYLASKKLIETDHAEVERLVQKRAQEAEIARRSSARDSRGRVYSAEELYEIPIDQLRDLALRNG